MNLYAKKVLNKSSFCVFPNQPPHLSLECEPPVCLAPALDPPDPWSDLLLPLGCWNVYSLWCSMGSDRGCNVHDTDRFHIINE